MEESMEHTTTINEKFHEECAVFGISSLNHQAAGATYNGLLAMQHRGQEGSGIAVAKKNRIHYHKGVGLVSDVFTPIKLDQLPPSGVAIGHNRYSTTGAHTLCNVQPFVTEYLTGRIATVHNGNVTNAVKIRDSLKKKGVHFEATSDTEVISSLIAYHIVTCNDFKEGIINASKELEGAFCLIVLGGDGRIAAIRDAYGFRPLCLGTNDEGLCIASESCALDSSGFTFVRDILPGEIVIIENGKLIDTQVVLSKKDQDPKKGLCIFEYVYFARPDSVIDHLSVYESRYNMGEILAVEHPVEADMVCGVPDSGLEAAIGYSAKSGIPLVPGFVKNRYIGRSFIYPTQQQRTNAVSLKLNPLRANVAGKRIVLIDDSIVRGTTCHKIVSALKDAGAKEVHMRISSPPFIHSCHYGTDIDKEEHLIANQYTLKEICEQIGADSLFYISMDGLKKACSKCNLDLCSKCFS